MWWLYTIPELKEQMQLDDHDPGNPNLIPKSKENKLQLIRRWMKYGDPMITDDFIERERVYFDELEF